MFLVTKSVLVLTLVVSALALCLGVVSQPSRLVDRPSYSGSVTSPASLDGLLDECGDYFMFTIPDGDFGTIPKGTAVVPKLPVSVPSYGYMSAAKFVPEGGNLVEGKDFKGYEFPTVLRALYQGYHVVWYETSIPDKALTIVTKNVNTVNASHSDKTLLLPWPAGRMGYQLRLPQDRNYAFSSWALTQSCSSFSDTNYAGFLKKSAAHDVKRDEANPPAAMVNAEGRLSELTGE